MRLLYIYNFEVMAVDNDIISVFDVNHMHEMKPTSYFATFTPYITVG